MQLEEKRIPYRDKINMRCYGDKKPSAHGEQAERQAK